MELNGCIWILLLLTAQTSASKSNSIPDVPNDQSTKAFQRRLERAAQDVTSQHVVLDVTGPPQLLTPDGFMHGYVSNTGAGNRQVTRISEILEEFLLPSAGSIQAWRHHRFNHTLYFVATTTTGCQVWITTPPFSTPLGSTTFKVIARQDDVVTLCDFRESAGSFLLTMRSRGADGNMIDVYEIKQGRANHILERSFDRDLHLTTLDDNHLVINLKIGDYVCHFQDTSGPRAAASADVTFPGLSSSDIFEIDSRIFLAVANSSECLIVSLEDNRCHLFDRISMPFMSSLTSFTYHSSTYLLASSPNVQRLYLWTSNGMTFVQQLTVPDVTETYVTSHQHCREDVFLVLVGQGRTISIYTWEWTSFDQSTGVRIPSARPSPKSLSFASRDDDLLVLFMEDGASRSLALRTAQDPVLDPALRHGIRTTVDMNKAETALHNQERRSRSSWDVLAHAVLTGPLDFEYRQTLPRLQSSAQVQADYLLSEIQRLEWAGSPLTSGDLKWTVGELDGLLKEMEDRLDALEEQLADAVLSNEPSVLTGHKTILGSVTSPSAAISALSLVEAGGRSIEQTIQHLFRLDTNTVISGKKTLQSDLHVTGHADLHLVNGVTFSTDVLLSSVPQHITGRWSFDHTLLVNGDLEMEGLLNDMDFSRQVVPLRSSTLVQGPKTFKHRVTVKETLTTPRLDGVEMEHLYLNSLTRTHNQVIHLLPPVLLETISSKISDLTVNGLVNGLDIERLDSETARSDRPADFSGRKTFVDPDFENGIVVLGSFDGVHLPFDVFEPAVENEFGGRKHFEHVVVRNARVHGWIDEINLDKDVVTLTGDQEVLDKVFANGVTIDGDLSFGDRIGGVTLEEMESFLTDPVSGADVNAVFLEPVIVQKNLVIENLVGVDLEALERDLVFPGDEEVVFTGRKSFGEVGATKVVLGGTVNGYDVGKDFVTTGTDQFINGTKVFRRLVVFGHHLETGNVDGVDLSSLAASHVSLSGTTSPSRTFYDKVTTTGVVTVTSHLNVTGRVNGMDLTRDLVLRDMDGMTTRLTNKVLAGGLTVDGHVDVHGDVRVGLLDGVDFDQFLQRRVTLGSDQQLTRSLLVGGSRASGVTTRLVNGVELDRVALDVMTTNTPQLVTGRKNLKGPVFIPSHIASLDGINGIDLVDLSSRVRRLDTPLTFDDHVTLDDLEVKGGIRVQGRVQGVDLRDLEDRALKKSSPLVLSGHNLFRNGLQVQGDILADGVNGRSLDGQILMRHGEQHVTGAYTLSTTRTGPLTITGPLNTLDLVQLDSSTAKTNRPSTFLTDLTLNRNVNVASATEVKGLVNGVSIPALRDQAVLKDGPGPLSLEGRKVFGGPVTVLEAAEVRTVAGVDFDRFLGDVVYVDRDQAIPSEKRFVGTFTAAGLLESRGHTQVTGRVDSVQLEAMIQNTVFIDQPTTIIGDVHYLDSSTIHVLTTTGRVNEISLHEDVLLLNKEALQTVRGKKTLQEVTSQMSIEVTGTVNSHRLQDLVQDTLFLHSDQAVLGTKTVTAPVTLVRPHYGQVNKVDLSQEVYVLDDDIEVHDNVIFRNDVILKSGLDLNGVVNGLDLSTLREEALMTTGYQEILSPFVVSQVVSGDVVVEGHVSGIDVDRLQREVHDFHSGQGQVVANLKVEVDKMAAVVQGMVHMAQVAPYSVHSVTLWQALNSSGYVLDASDDLVSLVDPYNPGLAQTWTWNGDHLLHKVSTNIHQDGQPNFVFKHGRNGLSSSSVRIAHKYPVAELSQDHQTVTARVSHNSVHFTRSPGIGGPQDDVTLDIPNANGARLFTSAGDVYALVSAGSLSLCVPGTVHLLRWNRDDPVPVPVQQFQGGDLDFGVFEVEGLQYIIIAGKDSNPDGHHVIQVYHRPCACPRGPFAPHSSTPAPNPCSLDLFTVDQKVYLAVANVTSVRLYSFRGLQGFRLESSLPVTHALNVRALVSRGEVFLAVGQMPGVADALLFKFIWNGHRLVPRHFTRWL